MLFGVQKTVSLFLIKPIIYCFFFQSDKIVLTDLTRDKNYEIVVVPFNSQGDGPPSPPVTVYVGEAVPTGEPRNLECEPVSSTEVRLKWIPPVQSQQNGDLLGYKVNSFYFYLPGS